MNKNKLMEDKIKQILFIVNKYTTSYSYGRYIIFIVISCTLIEWWHPNNIVIINRKLLSLLIFHKTNFNQSQPTTTNFTM